MLVVLKDLFLFHLFLQFSEELSHWPDQFTITQIFLLGLFEDEHDITFAFFQLLGTSSDCCNLPELIESGFVITSASGTCL